MTVSKITDEASLTPAQLRQLDIRDEADVLVTCKGYDYSDAIKTAQKRVQPLSAYLARAAQAPVTAPVA